MKHRLTSAQANDDCAGLLIAPLQVERLTEPQT